MNKPNPHGANANNEDPREQVMWDFYIQTVKAGSPNALQSAIKAGYTEKYARQITMQDWFVERCRTLKRKKMVDKAERVLRKIMSYEDKNGGEKIDTNLLRIKSDVAKFIATTQGKDKGYTTKTEVDHTTKGDKITAIGALIQEIEQK